MEASRSGTRPRLRWIFGKVLVGLLALVGFMGLAVSRGDRAPAPPQLGRDRVASSRRWADLYARLPLGFEENRGQTDRRVEYLARGRGYTVFLTRQGPVLALRGQNLDVRNQVERGPSSAVRGHWENPTEVVRLKLVGANRAAEVSGVEELPGRSNYFIGNDPREWHRGVRNFGRVRWREVWPGVEVDYYGRQGELENDFVVEAGADPKEIVLEAEGGAGGGSRGRLRIEGSGDLVIATQAGEVRLRKPVAYQAREETEGGAGGVDRQEVEARYVRLGGERIGVEVGGYDRGRRLVIDPVLDYATYLGGTGGDVGLAIAVDSAGSAFVAGVTNSADFPTASAAQHGYGGNGDAFVTKFNTSGTALVYSTYLGGAGSDSAAAIAVDKSDDAFVTGSTNSTNFPVTTSPANSFQTTFGGGDSDAFVTELGSAGNSLVYSSYLGGTGADFGQGIAVDGSGNAYVTGSTQSANFPTTPGSFQTTYKGQGDAFAAKVNFGGSALVYSTYLGGSAADVGQSIQVDGSGDAYVTGYTFSTNFPALNALQAGNAGPPDVFITELNPSGAGLVFSTYLGGTGDDRGFGIALDASGNIYVAGESQSADFPATSTAFQVSKHGQQNAIVAKLNAGGTSVGYATFLGGSGVDQGNSIAVDSSGDAFVTGFTNSSDFPTVNAVQAGLGITGGGTCGTAACSDAFVTELNPSGSAPSYSTYLGGSAADFGQGVALDTSGLAYVAGSTSSTNFPAIAGAFQGELKGLAGNAFVAKVDTANAPAIAIVPQTVNFGNQTESVRSSPQTVSIIDVGTQPLSISTITSSNTDFTETDNCVGTVSASGGNCGINVTFTPSKLGSETGTITITDNATGSPQSIAVEGSGVTSGPGSVTLSPSNLSFGNQTVSTVSSPQAVTITNSGTATINITQIAATGDFTQTNTCAALLNTLNPGQNCTANVTFAPTATGSRSGVLSVSDNATGSPQSIPLTGNGVAEYTLSATATTTTVLAGSTSATYKLSASAPASFTGTITLACSANATCSFSPTSIFAGQTSTLTLNGLTASTTSPFNFTVSGNSGSQTATLALTLLLQDFTLAGTPALDTVTPGASAKYTVTVAPTNGFNSQVVMGCTNLPAGAACSYNPTTVTPSGSAVTTALTIITTVQPAGSPWRLPPAGLLPPATWWLGLLGALLALIQLRIGTVLGRRSGSVQLVRHRLAPLALALVLAAMVASCRNVVGTSGGTLPGNYVITITGTLGTNKSVVRTTVVDLAVTPPPS